jgi:uncharacterized protein (TIGR03067 family)
MLLTDTKGFLAALLLVAGVCNGEGLMPSRALLGAGANPARPGEPFLAHDDQPKVGAQKGQKEAKSETDQDRLQGTWVLVGGRRPFTEKEIEDYGIKWTFKGELLDCKAKTSPVSDEGTFTLDPKMEPKTIDHKVTAGRYKGKTFLGIYKIDGDSLTICEGNPDGERPTEFKSDPKDSIRLLVFKRDKK